MLDLLKVNADLVGFGLLKHWLQAKGASVWVIEFAL